MPGLGFSLPSEALPGVAGTDGASNFHRWGHCTPGTGFRGGRGRALMAEHVNPQPGSAQSGSAPLEAENPQVSTAEPNEGVREGRQLVAAA